MDMELISVLRVLQRWLWLILALVLVTGLVLGLKLRSAEPEYAAKVKLQLSTPQQEDVAAFDQYRYVSLRDEVTVARNNFSDLLESDQVRGQTVKELELEESEAKYPLEVVLGRDVDFLYVSAKARTAELAARIANAHVDATIEHYGELRAMPIIGEKDLFAEQLRVAEEEYRDAEDAFAEFQALHGIASLETEIATYQKLLEQLQLERDRRILEDPASAVDPVADVDALIAERKEELERLTVLTPMYTSLEEVVQQARETYQLLLKQETEAAATPDASPTAEQIAIAKQQLRTAEDALVEFQALNGIVSLESEIATNQNLLEQLQLERDRRVLEGPNDSASLIGEIDKLIAQRQIELNRLVALTPMYDLLQETARQAYQKYQHVTDKFFEAQIKADVVKAANFIQVVEPAQTPLHPESGWKKTLLLGVVGSLGLGILLAFLLEYVTDVVDDTFRVDDADPQSVMGLPVLGSVPRLDGGRCEPSSSEAEAVRQLRTKILLSAPGGRVETMLVTSSQPGDGKTVVTANLGVAMAGGGARVLVVDADLRNPALHEWFDQPNLAGLADLLQTDQALLEQLLPQMLRDTRVPDLSLLSAGHLPQDPSLLLSSPNMVALLALLSSQFDVVVFDSPPVLTAPDASVLARLVQGTLLVLSPGISSRKTARQMVDMLSARDDVQITGIALNRTDLGPYAYRYYARPQARTGRLVRALSPLPLIGRPADPNLISVSRAAEDLGVRADTVERWCQDGRLPAEKRGLTWWVRRDDMQNMSLDRLLAGLPSEERLPALTDGRPASVSLLQSTARTAGHSSDSRPLATPSLSPGGTEEPVPTAGAPGEDAEAASTTATASV